MSGLHELESSLLRILRQLRPYPPDLVVIGGWVPHLYRRFGGFGQWNADLSLTAEVDTLVAPELPAGDRPPISTIPRQAGFEPVGDAPMAAVWANRPEVGEKIEFLLDHSGPFKTLGEIQAVRQQPGLGAIALEGLWFLREHTSALDVLSGLGGFGAEHLSVRVPLLGAYAANKAVTLSQRHDLREGTNPKRAKDLLYIRDLMSAGEEVVTRIGSDIRSLVKNGKPSELYLGRASANLQLLAGGAWDEEVTHAAAMLIERGANLSQEAARADIRGHAADLGDIVRAVLN